MSAASPREGVGGRVDTGVDGAGAGGVAAGIVCGETPQAARPAAAAAAVEALRHKLGLDKARILSSGAALLICSGALAQDAHVDFSERVQQRLRELGAHAVHVFYVERDDHIDVWRVLHAQRDIPAWMQEPES